MQRAEDLTDYKNRLNLVRMELEQLLKPPDESTRVVAFIQGLCEEFKSVGQLLSTGAVETLTLNVLLHHVCDSMLIPSAQTKRPFSAFLAEVSQSPSSENAVHDAIAAQLSTLTAQMKSLADSVATIVASSSYPSSACEHRHPVICSYWDKRGHNEADSYQRLHDIKRDADAVASTKTGVAAIEPPPPPIAGALWELPMCLSFPSLL
jgi:hypothetical protein